MTFGEGDPLVVSDVEVRRSGPRLYRLTGTIEGVETFDGESNSNSGSNGFTLFYTVDGDCPTSVASVEQFAQTTAIVLVSGEPVLQLQNPAVTDVFTANDLNVEEADRQNGDPVCGCNESTPYAGNSSSMAMRSAARSAPAETAEPATDYASLWGEIHTYPLTQGVDGLGDLLASVRDRLGCELCQSHLDEHVAATPPDTSSVDALFAWGVDFHNAINVVLCKGGLTVEQARARWAASPAG